jgi:transcriptional regulator with XRE-family HTH domain
VTVWHTGREVNLGGSVPEHSDVSMTFADRLRRLFAGVTREDGSRFTPREVAAGLTERGHKVSKSYLYALLAGESEPSHALVQALATFFGVPLEYFGDSDRGTELNRQYDVLVALGEANVRRIALRARDLSPEQLRSVLAYLDFEASRGGEDG